MSQSIGIKSSPSGPFVYVENVVGESLAFGSDNTAQMFVLNTSASPNVVPLSATANINFDPTANGNITFRPNGSGKIKALNVASNVVSNKNYVTINTSTGELGSDNAPLSSISITGDTGGALTGSSFTFTGGTTGLSFGGAVSTETLSGTLVVGNGGTGATSFTSHGVILGNATGALGVTAAGTTGQVLTGVTGSDPVWASPAASSISITGDSGGALTGNAFTFTGGTTGLTFAGSGATETLGGTLVVSNGGTGNTTFTAYSVICAGTTATGAFQNVSGVGSATQVLTSNGAAALPTWQSIPAQFVWNEVTGTSSAMAVNNGYIANNGALVTLTLPSTAALGSVMEVCGKGAGGWLIAQNSGQTIHFGASNTTTGVGGSLASSLQYDTVRLLCTTANTNFVVLSSVGNLTVV